MRGQPEDSKIIDKSAIWENYVDVEAKTL